VCVVDDPKQVVVVDGLAVLLRVQVVNDKTAEEQAMEAVSNHCHRGVLSDDTEIYIVAEKPGDGVGLRTLVPLEVVGAAARPSFEGAGDDDELHPAEIRVHTNDDEWFPVKRGLLKSCISLTSTLRDKASKELSVDLDCLVFVSHL